MLAKYAGKLVEQPTVIASDFKFDVCFADIIEDYHSVVGISATKISNAVNAAFQHEGLKFEDIKSGTIEVFKHGPYTVLYPNGKMKRKECVKRYRILPNNHIVELTLSVKEWLPFSKYRFMRDEEEMIKKVGREVAAINTANKRALSRMSKKR